MSLSISVNRSLLKSIKDNCRGIEQSYSQLRGFEEKRERLIDRLEGLRTEGRLKSDEILAVVKSSELFGQLATLLRTKLGQKAHVIKTKFSQIDQEIARKIENIRALKFGGFEADNEQELWMLSNFDNLGEDDFRGVISCNFTVNLDKFTSNLEELLTFGLKMSFKESEQSQRFSVIPLPETSTLLLTDLKDKQTTQKVIDEALEFRRTCTSLLLPDNSVCVIGTRASPTLIQRIYLDSFRVEHYLPYKTDCEFLSYVHTGGKVYGFAGGVNSDSCDFIDLTTKTWSNLLKLGGKAASCSAVVQRDRIYFNVAYNYSKIAIYLLTTHDNKSRELKLTSVGFKPVMSLSVNDLVIYLQERSIVIQNGEAFETITSPLTLHSSSKLGSTVNLYRGRLYFYLVRSDTVERRLMFWDIEGGQMSDRV
jgi:hypothetical protein